MFPSVYSVTQTAPDSLEIVRILFLSLLDPVIVPRILLTRDAP